MRYKYLLIVVCCLLSAPRHLIAQAPCATLQITGPTGGFIPCDSPLNLVANITFPTGIKNTNTYTHGPIPFNPQPWVGPNVILANIDNIWSGIIPMPFPFCFFGQVYTNMIVSSNGQIGFDLSQANLGNDWASSGIILPTNDVTFNNTIMSPHHDILPTTATSQITWGIFGDAPCRRMVVSWTNIPMFSCTTLIDTQQIVLYELTNEIEINIKNKPVCSTWNDGVAHEGIQNATGTVAYMAPGRNGTVWTATNDSYKFSPSGSPTPIVYNFTWKDSTTGAVLGTGPTLTIPPPVTVPSVILTVDVTGGCAPYSFSDTFSFTLPNTIADFTFERFLGCNGDTVKFTNRTFPHTPASTYLWSFGDGSFSTSFDTSHIYMTQGTYTVTLIANHPVCFSDTVQKIINFNHSVNASFTAIQSNITPGQAPKQDSTCLGQPIEFNAVTSIPTPGHITYHWDFGDGNDTTLTAENLLYTYAAPGIYTVLLTVTDTVGCTDTMTRSIFVDNPSYVSFVVSDSVVCVGEPIFFRDSVAPYTKHVEWDFGDGKTLRDNHAPVHTYDKEVAGGYVVTLTREYLVCPDASVSKTIQVYDYPRINLGNDTAICPGITGSITLLDLNGSLSLANVWSTGETGNSITVSQPGYYWLRASNGECATTDSIWIKRDCYLNVPNSFSPNGDGLNDYFLPRDLLNSGLRKFKMDIYNRWGELVFTTTSLDGRGWDGKLGGKDQPQGVFVYVIDAEFINYVKKNYKGNVTLVR